jgi:nucleoid DNA-binding protein
MNRKQITTEMRNRAPEVFNSIIHADEALKVLFNIMCDALRQGDGIHFDGYFHVVPKEYRATTKKGITGAIVEVPTRRLPHFKAGDTLKKATGAYDHVGGLTRQERRSREY